jgi:hypothetical protein
VAEVTKRAALAARNPQFDKFLFAPVGEDWKGAHVSVLSAFARLGVEPWQEAQELARLPADSARERLDALFARLPGVPALIINHRAIAEHLIALLPQLPKARAPAVTTAVSAATQTRSMAIFAFAIFLLASQAMILFQQPPTQGGGTGPPFSASSPTGK